MDFFNICTKEARGGKLEVYPDFTVGRSKDLMVRGGAFYAVWDEAAGLWSTDEYDIVRLVDQEIREYTEKLTAEGAICSPKYLVSFDNNRWNQFKKFMKNVSDHSTPLDAKLTFANTKVKKSDHVSRRLPYALAAGEHKAWDELVSVFYSDVERAKIEWAIGSIVAGDSKKLEKFLVLYGSAGTGKGTVLKIIEKLFAGYIAIFEAKALVGNNNNFATEVFKTNPLVAIQHDGDLSKIEDNSTLNSVVGHDKMRINEKYKAGYEMTISAFLFMGTNKAVKITDGKSGLIRRLIDVNTTGAKIDPNEYHSLMAQIDFELGAIAQHCLDAYREMGKNYYNTYRPTEMMFKTDVFFNFVEEHYDTFKEQDSTTLKQAYALYKEYAVESGLEFKLPMYKFREELKNYFNEFEERVVIDGVWLRSYYSGFAAQPYKIVLDAETKTSSLVMDETVSLFDELYQEQPAQGAKEDGTPQKRWASVETVLSDVDTTELHFVKVPENHIVIDFDLKGDDGKKSLERNLEAASSFPPTYAELSKSGAGVHLHYIYEGDVDVLAPEYSEGIEIKVYRGDASLRRKLTRCNNIAVTTINSGLPFKETKKMLDIGTIKSEKGLRELIGRNLRREIHPSTKPSMDFIKKILDDAYASGMPYDVSDLQQRLTTFSVNSTNQSMECLKIMAKMKLKSEETIEEVVAPPAEALTKAPIVIFDVEVYPNLFVICWKYQGSPDVVRMCNPTARDVEGLFQFRLVGYNNRKYDNHILWARFMGYSNEELYQLSQRIINNEPTAMFGEAYSLSYADIYDFVSEKKSLKKWGIEMGLHHMEMDLPWDQPVAKEDMVRVMEYCVNDVNLTEAVFEARQQDFVARQILADLSGLPVNATTRKHAEKILFGEDRKPQGEFVYTDLSEKFPGYEFEKFAQINKSSYRGEHPGEGGYVYAEPGMYQNVALLDVASMHPTSIEELNLFGKYTKKFSEIKEARLAIKHGETGRAKKMLDGKLARYIEDFSSNDEENLEILQVALKLVINSVYGYTSATFDNPFRDIRNIDNIVAKRGALFMIDLKHFVQEHGFQVVHIKTDSIKIPNATPHIIEAVMEFGKQYGYDFEHEGTYEKFCLVNDAVYIAYMDETVKKGKVVPAHWEATGAQFKHPYVFKSLFSNEPITFDDLCETKQVKSPASMYLEFEEGVATPAEPYKGMHFIGRVGRFVPVTEKMHGANLLRVKDDKTGAVTGTKGFKWLEAEMVQQMHNIDKPFFDVVSHKDIIDVLYFYSLLEDAVQTIAEFGDFEEFVK